MSSAIARARDEHAFIDIEPQPGEPRFVGEIGQRYALIDTPAQQSFDTLALCGGDAPFQHPEWRVVLEIQRVKHQGGRFIRGVVGAVAEIHACAPQATRDACQQIGDRDVE